MNKSSVEIFQFYYTPTLVYLGSIGNLVSVYVFLSPKLRKLSSSYYLSALAVSDTVFLIALFIVWLTMVGIDLFNQPGTCQIIVYITSMCSFLSVWFVVAFTVERFVAVRYPLLRHSICTSERAKLVLTCLIIIAVLLFSPLLFFAGTQISTNTTLCSVQPELQEFAAVFNFIDTVLTFLIPVIIIVILNICICQAVLKLDNTRKKLTVKRTVIFTKGVKAVKQEYCGTQKKVTKMLLIVSSTFLCFNLPSYIMRVLTYLIEILTNVDLPLFLSIQHWCLQFFNTNFGVNFVLYCIGGQNFRKAVKATLCKNALKRTATPQTGSESRPHSTSTLKSSNSRKNFHRSSIHNFNNESREKTPAILETDI